jgi:hypothetical protein
MVLLFEKYQLRQFFFLAVIGCIDAGCWLLACKFSVRSMQFYFRLFPVYVTGLRRALRAIVSQALSRYKRQPLVENFCDIDRYTSEDLVWRPRGCQCCPIDLSCYGNMLWSVVWIFLMLTLSRQLSFPDSRSTVLAVHGQIGANKHFAVEQRRTQEWSDDLEA